MEELEFNPEKRITLFQRKEVCRVIHNKEWWFIINDVVAALTDSVNPQGYFKDMRSPSNLSKGGGKLPPPLVSCLNAQMPRAFSTSFNPFQLQGQAVPTLAGTLPFLTW
jgi:hypothetical protein